VTMVARL